MCRAHRGWHTRGAHAVRVALTVGRHVPDAAPALIAAVLLREAPGYVDIDVVSERVAVRCGVDTLIALWLLHGEETIADLFRHDLDAAACRLTALRSDIAAVLAADMTVRIDAILSGARQARNARVYWAQRRGFLLTVPYLRALLAATSDRLPEGLAGELDRLIRQLRRAVVTAIQPSVWPRR
ncbi:hypothetical protein MXD62_23065 [Frankia sp. Mgl5]|uniref:hypothetical protein n=1 Tax=Frankia sp. Mgl5 TaxID=2933793 RepID=UPI00200ED108|nr:hypothetical protein [Frankia sp. Mgl5]MCK9930011.1 hypothetical protein [Frankia sp. Mgl5]